MIEMIWKKSSYITGMLCFGVLMGLVVFLAGFEVTDFDLWLHLKAGEIIVEQGFFPVKDIFSCTMAGQPWNNHEWLFQVIFYLALSFGGVEGLFTVQALIVAVTLLFLFLLSDIHRRHWFTVLLLFFLTMMYQTRFTMRPDLLSLLFFVIYIYILALHLDKRISLWILTGIQILWVNVHGFFIFGPLLVLLSIVAELIKRHMKLPWEWNEVGRLTNEEMSRMKLIFFFGLLACLANPQHIQGALYPLSILWQVAGDSKIFFSHIQELQKPIPLDTLFSLDHVAYKALIFISGYSFIVNRRRIDISALCLWVFFLIFSLQAVRNILFFGVVAYLVSVLNFLEKPFEDILPVKFRNATFKLITAVFLNILLIIWMVDYGFKDSQKIYFNFDKYEMKSYFGGVNLRAYPWAATQFIKDNNIQGNFFNDFNAGAFLIGRCSPQVRVFIDGRTEFYGPQFFKEYIQIWDRGNEAVFLDAVKKYDLTGVLLSTCINSTNEKMLQHLYRNKEWVLVYLDHDATIFLKDTPEHQEVIKKFRKDEKNFVFSNIDFQRLGPRGVFPYREIKRAYALEALGLDDLAFEQTTFALLTSPESSEPYYIRGKIFKKRKDFQRAFEDFRIATMLSDDEVDTRYQLGLMYAALGNHKEAIRHWEILVKRKNASSDVFFSLTRSLAIIGEKKRAIDAARRGMALRPTDIKTLQDTADMLMKKKQYVDAIALYNVIASADPRNALAYQRIGLSYKFLKQYGKAQEAFLRGLGVSPQDPDLKREMRNIKRFIRKIEKEKTL